MSGLTPLFGDEHHAYREAAKRFVATEIEPHVEQWETAGDYPRELFNRVGAAGLFGAKFHPTWGGTGPDWAAEAVWVEELSRCGSFGVAADLGAHSQLASLYLDRYGDDGVKERWLRPAITGELLGALAVTEPDAGSDVAAITTRARRQGGDWVLDGTKLYITNGSWSDFLIVAAKTSDGPRHQDITLFVVDAASTGVERRRMRLIAWHTSHTGEIHFDSVRVPDQDRLGEVGTGFGMIMANFQWERLVMSLGAVALAERALETAIAYARERRAFGRPVIGFQVWQHRFADLATRIRAGKALTHRALRLHVAAGEQVTADELTRLTAMAKLYTQRLAWEAADECVQVHGGAGALMEYPAQRLWRDARVGPIGGGSDEIMRGVIARSLGLGG